MTDYAIGLDLGGTNIKAGVVDSTGRVLSQLSLPTGVCEGSLAVIRRLALAADRARQQAGLAWAGVRAVGLG
ncbi:MAG TPA: glucokinase, partial [Candidatus Brocadiia bacterium]|nr:glucokinase [Candidatus Brocadiia bacterium]